MKFFLLVVALLALPNLARAQCCGDCNGDGEVTINELITAVNNALGMCAADSGLFVGADVVNEHSASIIGWFKKSDASDITALSGSITLGTNGTTLAVDPDESPFDIEDCAFIHYRGDIEDVLVPTTATALQSDQCPIDFRDDNTQPGTADCYYIGRWNQQCGAADLESLWRSDGDVVIVDLLGFTPAAARAAARLRAVDPAALARLRAAVVERHKQNFERH